MGKKNLIVYIIIISILQFLIVKNDYIMIKLWLMISHMSFMINEWNVPHHWHIIVPHHVLDNYYP
jgi:hypothetical protein